MKKVLLLCLLGLGLLLPSTTVTAKEFFNKRIITVGIEGWVLTANSEKSDGAITLMEIRTVPDGKLEISQSCGDYSCSTDISGLPSGAYVVKVYCPNSTYVTQFKK